MKLKSAHRLNIALVSVLTMLAVSGITPLHAPQPKSPIISVVDLRPTQQEPSLSAAPPPFVSPANDVPTVLDGMRKVRTPEDRFTFHWRLFSPNISRFEPGNFWISFDISCELPDKFDDVTVELVNPDDSSDTGGIAFGDQFDCSILTQESEFLQYTGFRNSTYFFMNDTHPSVTYPAVDDEMEFRLRISGPSFDVYAFNLTILTETLRPEIEILSPPVLNRPEGDLVRLDNNTNTLAVSISDPTGIHHSALWGLYTNTSTSQHELFLLANRTDIVNGVPFEIVPPLDSILQYAELSGQRNQDTIIIAAVLAATDLVGMSTQRLFRIEYTLRYSGYAETDMLDFLQVILPMLLTGLSSVVIVGTLIAYVKTQRQSLSES